MFINFILSGVFLGVGSWFPESYLCFFFFLISAVLFRLALENPRIYIGAFLTGVFFHAIAFYWLCKTVQVFGGLTPLLGVLVMALFSVTAAIQFVLVSYIYSRLKKYQFIGSLALPCAWLTSNMFWPKMFPWEIAHGLIVVKPIAGLAEYVGVPLLSFIFIWWACVLVDLKKTTLIKCLIITLLLIVIGHHRNILTKNEIEKSPEVDVALIQGNLSLEVKGKQSFFNANLEKYLQLSKLETDLVVWPESVVSKWLHRDLQNINQLGFNFGLNVPILFGGLAYELRDSSEIEATLKRYPELDTQNFLQSYSIRKFNAAIGVDAQGNILGQYFKRVLMPFGEYFPFSNKYPKLIQMFPMIADFTSGDILEPIKLPKNINAGTLICYEDLIAKLSSDYVQKGANILINLTNDAWYGDTPASHQHHLLALWRAIETRRYFLRATNTGYTAVVSPFGETIEKLPIFKEDIIKTKVKLLESKSLYSVFRDLPCWVVVFFVVVLLINLRLNFFVRFF